MRIIYDSELPQELRVTIEFDKAEGPKPCGCFDIRVEETAEDGGAGLLHKVSRWATTADQRHDIHKSVAAALKKKE